MNTMICYECVMKHLANALSYGKEILSGHTRGAELDHRIDFLGELGNAEHHLELIDRNLFMAVSNFRRAMQSKKNIPDSGDLELLRKFFLIVEKRSEGTVSGTTAVPFAAQRQSNGRPMGASRMNANGITMPMPDIRHYEKPLDIVFPKVTNREYFELALKSIRKFAENAGRIYWIESDIDMKEFDVEKLESFSDPKLSEHFMYWQENMCLLRRLDLLGSFSVYGYPTQKTDIRPITAKIRSRNPEGTLYLYDGLNPQPVETVRFNEIMKDTTTDLPLTLYFNSIQEKPLYTAIMTTVIVDKTLCCSTRSRLKSCLFANWNNAGFESLKKALNMEESELK